MGLMGELARTVVTGSGSQAVMGVIPEALIPREVSGEMLGQLHIMPDMHSRKALMAKHADGFIAMPGDDRHRMMANAPPPADLNSQPLPGNCRPLPRPAACRW